MRKKHPGFPGVTEGPFADHWLNKMAFGELGHDDPPKPVKAPAAGAEKCKSD